MVVDAAMEGRFVMVTSYHLVEELADVLRRPRIRAKYAIEPQRLAGVLGLVAFAEVVPGVPRQRFVEKDPDDDWVVAAALEAGADAIVTEDQALLDLRQIENVKVLSGGDFLRALEATA